MTIIIDIRWMDGTPMTFSEAEEEGAWADVLKFIEQGNREGRSWVGGREYVWTKGVTE